MTGPSHLDRHHRQRILPQIGDAGQERLRNSHAAIVGCGALGTHLAQTLCRAGVGWLTIIDRDVVELTNLQRQVLFTERHARDGAPKALAAKESLAAIDANVNVRAIVDDLNAGNIDELLPLSSHESDAPPISVILDGTDNFETRFLLNDYAVKYAVPYVYAGVIGMTGLMMVTSPSRPAGGGQGEGRPNFPAPPSRPAGGGQGEGRPNIPAPPSRPAGGGRGEGRLAGGGQGEGSPCLRCLFDEAPGAGAAPTCDTAGVFGPAVSIITGFQAAEAIKILIGAHDQLTRALIEIDAWTGALRRIDTSRARRDDCPCCALRRFEYLDGAGATETISLCGRNAVQITPGAAGAIDLNAALRRLAPHGDFHVAGPLLRGVLTNERGESGDAIDLTLFESGRAIIKGTQDPTRAKAIYTKFVGV